MPTPRWLKSLSSWGLEFWLPLPLLGIAFWSLGGWVTHQVLSRPYHAVDQLQADTRLEVKLSVTVRTIQAEIDKNRGLTTVTVTTADSVLKQLDFEFPVTEFTLVEAAIAQELGLSIEYVRKLVRYEVK